MTKETRCTVSEKLSERERRNGRHARRARNPSHADKARAGGVGGLNGPRYRGDRRGRGRRRELEAALSVRVNESGCPCETEGGEVCPCE